MPNNMSNDPFMTGTGELIIGDDGNTRRVVRMEGSSFGKTRGLMRSAAAGLAMAAASIRDTINLVKQPAEASPRDRSHRDKPMRYYGYQRWVDTHGFSGAKLMRKATNGEVGRARLK